MQTQTFEIDNETVITLRPDSLPENYRIIWLIAPTGEGADSWITKTKAGSHAENANAMLMCLPGGKDKGFYSEKVWNAVKEKFPDAGSGQKDRRLIGLADSGILIFELVFSYPEKFFTAISVSPEYDDAKELIDLVEQYSKGGRDIPRLVIADSAEGQGRALGDAINKYGFGLHLHDDRPCSGWELADFEVASCLAHL